MEPSTYRNPVLRGFFPDPSIVRVGNDYYMANSTFQYFPAIVLSHSRDLIHWKTVGHVFSAADDLDLSGLEDSHGIWAPDLSWHQGQYLMYATLRLNDPPAGSTAPRRRQIFSTAPHPTGPWSKPVYLEIDNIDPSHFTDSDGQRYLLIAPGATLIPLMPDGAAPSGPPQCLWEGTGRRAPEGPRLIWHDGWYVLLLAEGGTEWGHCVTAARSRHLRGPYEPCPHNPILIQGDATAPLQRTGHGQLVQTPSGDWWMVYLCGRPNEGPYTTLGRETALDPVVWVEDWPVVNGGKGPSLGQHRPRLPAAPQSDPGFDGFDGTSLAPLWQGLRRPSSSMWSLSDRPGWLRLSSGPGRLVGLDPTSVLLRREQDHHYTARVHMNFSPLPGTEAGLTCYYDRRNHLTLAVVQARSTQIRLTEVRDGRSKVLGRLSTPSGPLAVVLEVIVRGQSRTFRAQIMGESWRTVGKVADCRFLSDEGVVQGKHHTGTLVGPFVQGDGAAPIVHADFDWFDYRSDESQKSPKGGHQCPTENHYHGSMDTLPGTAKETSAPWLALAKSVVARHRAGTEKWHYEHGLLLGALEAVGRRTGDPTLGAFVQAYMEKLVAPDGTILTYRDDEFNLDQVNPGKVAMLLAERSSDPRWTACQPRLRDQLRHQPRTASGGFWHKKIYPDQMWLDGLYMQGPFLARWGREHDVSADLDEAVAQLVLIESQARDQATGLLYHAWDESHRQLWAHPVTGCSPHFWSRAMGWYAMALVDVLEWLPKEHRGVRTLCAILSRLADALARVQDPETGLWYQVMDQATRKGNYRETSGSAMFVYALSKGLNRGWLTDAGGSRSIMADRAWNGLLAHCLSRDSDGQWHLGGICSVAGLGGTPYRDGSFEYYISEPVIADDFKGVGPFILAGLEREVWS